MENQQRPSSWVNLQDYLDLNKDQAAEMGNKLNASLREKGAGARQQIGKASNAFQSQADAAAFADPNAKNPSGFGYNTMAAPTAAQARTLAATEYKGPRQLSDVDPNVSAAVGDAMARLNAAKTTSGAATLMQDAAKSPSSYYGATAGGLDALLAGQGAANASLAATQAEFGGLGAELGLAADKAAQTGDSAYGRHEAARGAYRSLAQDLQEREDTHRAWNEQNALADRVNRAAMDSLIMGAGNKANVEAQKQDEDFRWWHGGQSKADIAKLRQRTKDMQGNVGSRRSNEGLLNLDEAGNPIDPGY